MERRYKVRRRVCPMFQSSFNPALYVAKQELNFSLLFYCTIPPNYHDTMIGHIHMTTLRRTPMGGAVTLYACSYIPFVFYQTYLLNIGAGCHQHGVGLCALD